MSYRDFVYKTMMELKDGNGKFVFDKLDDNTQIQRNSKVDSLHYMELLYAVEQEIYKNTGIVLDLHTNMIFRILDFSTVKSLYESMESAENVLIADPNASI